jgi:hypothetical protein
MRSPICKRLSRQLSCGGTDSIIPVVVFFAFVCLRIMQVAAAPQKQYPVFTEANLEKAMKAVGTSLASGKTSLAANDIAGSKSQFVHAREELAVTIAFWRERNRDDAIRMLRATLAKLDEFDTALSEQTVDRNVSEGLARRVEEACEACHAVYREQDSSTKAYRLRRGSI